MNRRFKTGIIITALSSITLSLSLLAIFNNQSFLKSRGQVEQNIESGVLTFDKSHTNVRTAHGNLISLTASGSGKLGGNELFTVKGTNSDGYLWLSSSTPIQSIESVYFDYQLKESCHYLTFYAGATYGSGSFSQQIQYLPSDLNINSSYSHTFTSPDQFHYFYIKFGGLASDVQFYIHTLRITYSCSY